MFELMGGVPEADSPWESIQKVRLKNLREDLGKCLPIRLKNNLVICMLGAGCARPLEHWDVNNATDSAYAEACAEIGSF